MRVKGNLYRATKTMHSQSLINILWSLPSRLKVKSLKIICSCHFIFQQSLAQVHSLEPISETVGLCSRNTTPAIYMFFSEEKYIRRDLSLSIYLLKLESPNWTKYYVAIILFLLFLSSLLTAPLRCVFLFLSGRPLTRSRVFVVASLWVTTIYIPLLLSSMAGAVYPLFSASVVPFLL